MSKKMLAIGATVVSMLGCLVGCATEVDPVQEEEPTASSEEALGVVYCNPRNPDRACDRGETCWQLPVRDRDARDFVCTAGRCDSARDCGPGYSCRLNHCLALERTPWRHRVRGVRADGVDRDRANDEARTDDTRR